jgi:hypothetical protein
MCGPEPPASCPPGCAQCTPQPSGGRDWLDSQDDATVAALAGFGVVEAEAEAERRGLSRGA